MDLADFYDLERGFDSMKVEEEFSWEQDFPRDGEAIREEDEECVTR